MRKRIRIAIYSRYSGKNQNPLSSKEQADRASKLIHKKLIPFIKFGYSIYDFESSEIIYFSDDAKSGTKVGRAGYDAFKRCIEGSDCDVAVVDDLSRIVRDLGEQMDFFHLLRFKEVELYSICDQISSESPNAKIYFQIKGMANEMERDQNAARTRRGQEARVDKGFSCGDICFGYSSRPTQERMQGGRSVPSHYEIYINVEQAPTVILIYDLYLKGLGLTSIAKELNRRQIQSPTRGQKITGKKINWNASTIRKILTNEKYIGIWRWGRTTSVYNPMAQKKVKKNVPQELWHSHRDSLDIREDLIILSRDKWDQVQKRLEETTRKFNSATDKSSAMRALKQTGSKGQTLLAGVLKCDECGSNMLLVSNQKGGYYGCYTHHRKDESKCSNKRVLSRMKIEALVIKSLQDILLDQAVMASASKTLNEKIRDRLRMAPDELKSLEQKKSGVEKEIHNLLKFIIQNGDSSLVIKESLAEREGELKFYNEQILALRSANADKMFVTPLALREKFLKLNGYFESDPIMANASLRKLMPDGLKCRSLAMTEKKNLNQNNSKWRIAGILAISNQNCTALTQPNLIDLNFNLGGNDFRVKINDDERKYNHSGVGANSEGVVPRS